MDRQTNGQTGEHMDGHMNRKTGQTMMEGWKGKQMDKPTDRDRMTDRQKLTLLTTLKEKYG